jgi:hypothetical protein
MCNRAHVLFFFFICGRSGWQGVLRGGDPKNPTQPHTDGDTLLHTVAPN